MKFIETDEVLILIKHKVFILFFFLLVPQNVVKMTFLLNNFEYSTFSGI